MINTVYNLQLSVEVSIAKAHFSLTHLLLRRPPHKKKILETLPIGLE